MRVFLLFIIAALAGAYTLERHYFFGGDFSKVYRPDNSQMNVTGFFMWDGYNVTNVGSVDGIIYKVYVDPCYNVWIAGSFQNVIKTDNTILNTGPIAKFQRKSSTSFDREWVSIDGQTSPSAWYVSGTIRDLHIDCLNIPSSLTCPCSVYFGGNFVGTPTAGGTTRNAMYYYQDYQGAKSFKALSGSSSPIDNSNITVTGIYKKYMVSPSSTGRVTVVTFNADPWIATWESDAWGSIGSSGKINNQVNAFYFYLSIIWGDYLYLGGKFDTTDCPGGTCRYYFGIPKIYNSAWATFGCTNNPTGTVKAIKYNYRVKPNNHVVVAGDISFTSSGTGYQYVARCNEESGKDWQPIASGGQDTNIQGAVNTMWVCPDLLRADCNLLQTDGFKSVFAGSNWVALYNGKSSWERPSYTAATTNGPIYSVDTYYTIDGAAASMLSMGAVLAFLLLTLL